MFVSVILSTLLGVAAAQVQQAVMAKTYTGWDCCKPACANALPLRPDIIATRGAAASCRADNTRFPLQQSLLAASACNGGAAFLCAAYQPVPVSDTLSYGFAILMGGAAGPANPACCRCYEAQWTSGAAAGKKIVVQVVNIAESSGTGNDIGAGDLILITPGGGVGPHPEGCRAQYGQRFANSWGADYGGVTSRENCANLPDDLQGGCYWRYNWAGGEVNGWDIIYQPVTCPSRLTEISGCAA
ncbi:uncharacterized protein DNG_01663 [Cephalotrichum gorgonifer]|uniref:cellulase n=1 Tax=Cephalotrichum gorgonifer TaxID=2041049 RepID=A0AAE8MRY1_9PEZI|nr:uncharacterized protein DNG_01663 [Cephalotrichum gorgonifer]